MPLLGEQKGNRFGRRTNYVMVENRSQYFVYKFEVCGDLLQE